MENQKLKVLFIIGHPTFEKSFNHKLVFRAEEALKKKGCEVKIVDLYEIDFDPTGGKKDFTKMLNPEHFDYQIEQKHAAIEEKGKTYSQDLREQMKNIKWCDVVVFQFPLYWFSMPAIVKGYFDRVFAYYWAYGGGNNLAPRKAMISCTTGGPNKESGGRYDEEMMDNFFVSTITSFVFCGMKKLPSYYCMGLNLVRIRVTPTGPVFERPNHEDYENWLKGFEDHLIKHLELK